MPITTRAAGFAIAAIAVTTPAPALAGNAVYGGSTSAGAAIAINADKKAKKLRSAIVSWKAACDARHGGATAHRAFARSPPPPVPEISDRADVRLSGLVGGDLQTRDEGRDERQRDECGRGGGGDPGEGEHGVLRSVCRRPLDAGCRPARSPVPAAAHTGHR